MLQIKGRSYKTIKYEGAPWEKGFYDIEIADYAHAPGERYTSVAPKAKVWFHIGHGRSDEKKDQKYIHTGSVTLGCITLDKTEKWNEVYEVLIRARLGDSKSVGILEVID